MKLVYVPAFLFLTLLIHEAWTLLQFFILDPHALIKPFPFSEAELSKAWYVFWACGYVILAMFSYMAWKSYHILFTKWFFYFSVLELFEFFITYNQAWFFIPNPIFPVAFHITNIRMVTLFLLGFQFYYNHKWNLGK